ncbi:hypothetical protein ACFQX7_36505 [Luedemannella flava]
MRASVRRVAIQSTVTPSMRGRPLFATSASMAQVRPAPTPRTRPTPSRTLVATAPPTPMPAVSQRKAVS